MIVCDDFVFLHLHKSGGTFVNSLLLRCDPSARRIGYHLPYPMLPSEHRALPVLGTVRNPFAYYVSWYAFQHGQKRPNALFRQCSNDGARGFEETIGAMLRLSSDDAALEALRAELPDDFLPHGLNLTKACLDRLKGAQCGFYTFLHDRLYEGTDRPEILRTEHLKEQLTAFLERHGRGGDPLTRYFLEHAPRLNRSMHDPVPDHYSAALRRLVSERDRTVLDHYGYSFADA